MLFSKAQDVLYDYIDDPQNYLYNRRVADHYFNIGQTASAMGYYLRSAERSGNNIDKYQCLIRAAECMIIQGTRDLSTKGLLQHAITVLPIRPEAYFYLSRFHQNTADGDSANGVSSWFDGYMIASLALKTCDFNLPEMDNFPNDYPGKYGLLFKKSVCAWWCGLCEESRDIMHSLLDDDKNGKVEISE